MSITQVNVGSPTNLFQYTDTAMGTALDAVKASSTVLFSVFIDNTLNGGAASYVKLFNVASGSVTLGTTAPDEIIYVPAGAKITHQLFTAGVGGKTFATALTAACTTTGGTAGTTAPSSNVAVTFLYQ